MRFFSDRPGLTFIELMVTTVVVGILTTIVFTGLSLERSRGIIRRTSEQLQIDIQGAQIKAQSGTILSTTELCSSFMSDGTPDPAAGKPCRDATVSTDCTSNSSLCTSQTPYSYGFSFTQGNASYQAFADVDLDGRSSGVNPNRLWDSVPAETGTLVRLPATIQIAGLRDDSSANIYSRLDLSFDVPTGRIKINFPPGNVLNCLAASPSSACKSATVILKHLALNVCYGVKINAAALGTVNRRASIPCP